jgi:hypothetical protein
VEWALVGREGPSPRAFTILLGLSTGRSLSMVADMSIDLAFSFDSLVHAEVDVIEGYIAQLRHKLTPDGIAFLHHSNFAQRRHRESALEERERLGRDRLPIARRESLTVVSQERINWGRKELSDCITVLTPTGSGWERAPRIVDNPGFMAEAIHIATWAPLYTRSGSTPG